MNMNQIVPFKGINIPTAMKDGVVYVALRPIVEALGLEWQRQNQKLMENKTKFNCVLMYMVAQDGKKRRMSAIALERFPGWVFSINPNKVSPRVRPVLISFQDESFDVLFSYWYFGEAKNPRISVERIKSAEPIKLFADYSDTKIRHSRLKAEVRQAESFIRQLESEFHRRGLSANASVHALA